MDLYAGWSEAVGVGRDEIEGYLDAHLYPDLPRCAPGEKTLPIYTAQRETIRRDDEWVISWGPLNGVQPDGRVYEVQLAELESALTRNDPPRGRVRVLELSRIGCVRLHDDSRTVVFGRGAELRSAIVARQ